jgi:hypothetical protein
MSESRTYEIAFTKTHFASAEKVVVNLTKSEAIRLMDTLNYGEKPLERFAARWRWANLNEITRAAGCVVIDGEAFRECLTAIFEAEAAIREAVEKS